MNYQQYFPLDVVNGPGTRCTLFVSGCEHQCRGCYNQSTWNPCSGHEFDRDMVAQIISDLKDTRVKRRGLSLSGGDPLFPANVPAILALVQLVKRECPDKDIWLWSGYLLEELSAEQSQVLDYIDVLVDGKFEQQLADPSLQFRGSSNQVIHHLKQ
ncbi:anaerobic ribonucleoside-triphosphate reductase-activating protein [Shewanella colwelliana]|uniref:Anaerobic ribonucleoside-triphosphate reductase-activating protein n=1 Tax=Shewanella colwelliana TaxID=23 RepID=A0A1E5IXK2_SHECO|nr:anaerobic ribonucleoside-triphosphate reductase-activating protein [Shewanella colwelliana]MDX1282177.1 anaerobic ribonucleoside-triphosphate reductase-activating protein [Shewanella colwelliana]OEG75280.1 anaerobic ribonucleotide reductase-activating protein [Shewanella colwelliana]GIU36377.1 anaerobic ribonucleoside-triphosphate reductase-activating protein [Shewanella colwelliana]